MTAGTKASRSAGSGTSCRAFIGAEHNVLPTFTMIGRAFRDDRQRGAIALAVAAAMMAAEFGTQYLDSWPYHQRGSHLVIALGVVVVMWKLAQGDAETLGLRT